MTLTVAIFGFAICAVVIFFAGKQLSVYGDMLAEKTGWGKAWVGLVVMSAVTTLPEAMVGISSVRIVGSPDLAVGNVLGSCAFNLGVLALLDALSPTRQSILGNASKGHILAAGFGVLMVAIAGAGLYFENVVSLTSSISLSSVLLAIIYPVALFMIFKHHQKNPSTETETEEKVEVKFTLTQILLRYALFAAIIITAALFIPTYADVLALQTGLGQSFVGTLLLAASTSLPEIAIATSAVRRGSTDIALGNLLGANIINMFILFVNDMFYTQGHLLNDASDTHLISAIAVLLMAGIAIAGITLQKAKKRFALAWDTMAILGVYLVSIILLHRYS